jgi:hypothetical protein
MHQDRHPELAAGLPNRVESAVVNPQWFAAGIEMFEPELFEKFDPEATGRFGAL